MTPKRKRIPLEFIVSLLSFSQHNIMLATRRQGERRTLESVSLSANKLFTTANDQEKRGSKTFHEGKKTADEVRPARQHEPGYCFYQRDTRAHPPSPGPTHTDMPTHIIKPSSPRSFPPKSHLLNEVGSRDACPPRFLSTRQTQTQSPSATRSSSDLA